MIATGSPAPDLELQTTDGDAVRLSTAWAERPAVLVFIRHFGCVFCRQQILDLRSNVSKFAAAGVNLALVTQGEPGETKDFVAKYRWPGETFCDPGRAAYEAYGLGMATLSEAISPGVVVAAGRAALRGAFQGRVHGGEGRQMPGLFIVDTAGVVRYAHPFRHAGDQPTSRELLKIVRSAVGEPTRRE